MHPPPVTCLTTCLQDQYEDNKSPLNSKLAEYGRQGYFAPNFSLSFDLSLPSVTAFLPNTVSPNHPQAPL